MNEKKRTRLGEYLQSKAVNQSQIARRTGLSKQRVSKLSIDEKTRLKADELFLIALAIGGSPCELVEYICGHLREKVDPNPLIDGHESKS
ncbi:MAG: helix-turn-helix transcriptional regulator [Leptolyngbya sp. SIO1D8]|nr:helix-turn-helix transcriptional regulator [Leptolyngbya sp. SIO1D8]